MIIEKKKFKELKLEELYSILKIRQEVFIVEQKCFYLDCDGFDLDAIHFLGYEKEELVAYMRVLKNEKLKSFILGRILVSKKNRKLGLGINLIKNVISYLENDNENFKLEMSAQTYLISFYKKFNFKVEGGSYLDAGIPHVKMIKK